MTSKLELKLMSEMKKKFDWLHEEVERLCKREVAFALDSYKAGITTLDKWCCQNMQNFAAEFFNISSPKGSTIFRPQLVIHNMSVNYCPFCGVKL